MKKKELLEALDGLDDNAEIHVYGISDNMDGEYAYDIYTDDKVTGEEVQNEISLVAYFEGF